jgi:hypothetical protein
MVGASGVVGACGESSGSPSTAPAPPPAPCCEVGGLGGQPRRERGRGPSSDHVEQPRRTALIVGGSQVDDQGDEPFATDSSGCPATLVDPDHPYPGQPIRSGCGDQISGRSIAMELTARTHPTRRRSPRWWCGRPTPKHISSTPPRRRGHASVRANSVSSAGHNWSHYRAGAGTPAPIRGPKHSRN